MTASPSWVGRNHPQQPLFAVAFSTKKHFNLTRIIRRFYKKHHRGENTMQTASQTASQTEVQTDQPIQNRQHCRHINLAGGRCGSPALRGENFCFYHHATRRAIPPPTPGQPHHLNSDLEPFALPVLEDRASIQLAISQVVARIASNDLDLKRARLLLFGLQIAIRALPREESEPTRNRSGRYTRTETADTALDTDQIELDPHLGPLAPIADYKQPEERKSVFQRLLEDLKSRKSLDPAEQDPEETTIPTIHAAADPTSRRTHHRATARPLSPACHKHTGLRKHPAPPAHHFKRPARRSTVAIDILITPQMLYSSLHAASTGRRASNPDKGMAAHAARCGGALFPRSINVPQNPSSAPTNASAHAKSASLTKTASSSASWLPSTP
jgi:hypothetical protein